MVVVIDCIPSDGRPKYDKRLQGTVNVMDEHGGKFEAVKIGLPGEVQVLVPLFEQTPEIAKAITDMIEEYATEESNVVIALQDGKIGVLIH